MKWDMMNKHARFRMLCGHPILFYGHNTKYISSLRKKKS